MNAMNFASRLFIPSQLTPRHGRRDFLPREVLVKVRFRVRVGILGLDLESRVKSRGVNWLGVNKSKTREFFQILSQARFMNDYLDVWHGLHLSLVAFDRYKTVLEL